MAVGDWPMKIKRPTQAFIPSRQGWVCPKCGRVHGPTMLDCYPCNKKISDAEKSLKP